METKSSLIVWILLMIFPLSVGAQITFEAKLSRDRLGLNENLKIEFTMNENGDDFIPPSFAGFKVISGPSQTVSRQFVNGVGSFSKSYSYFLQPSTKGQLTIGQASITIQGEVYKTSPVSVQVTDAVSRPNDPNNYEFRLQDNIHFVAHVSNPSPYLNQGVLVEYKLYFQDPLRLSDVSEIDSPSYADFWSNNIDFGQIKVNPRGSYRGQPYNEVLWKKVLLFPQRSGKIELEPLVLSMKISVPTNRRDLFGSRIYNQIQENISTIPRTLDVKDLPTQGKPAGFGGAVGKYDFDLLLDKTSLNATESLQIRVNVKGSGNLGLFPLPQLNAPSNLEVFQPERNESFQTMGSTSSGLVEDIYTVVPRYQGSYPIPSLTFSYFDPEEEVYKMINSQEEVVQVYGGPAPGANQATSTNITGQPSNLVSGQTNSFRFINLDTSLVDISDARFWLSRTFWVLFLLPFFLMFGVILVKKLIFNREVDISLQQQKTANKLARRYLSAAKKEINRPGEFYMALERGLHTYLKAKLKIETIEFNKSKIQELLIQSGVHQEIITGFNALLTNCEQARYGLGQKIDTENDYNNASRIMAKLDKQL